MPERNVILAQINFQSHWFTSEITDSFMYVDALANTPSTCKYTLPENTRTYTRGVNQNFFSTYTSLTVKHSKTRVTDIWKNYESPSNDTLSILYFFTILTSSLCLLIDSIYLFCLLHCSTFYRLCIFEENKVQTT